MKPNFMSPTAYQMHRVPAAFSGKIDAHYDMEKYLKDRVDSLQKVADSISRMEIREICANKTGNKVDVKIRVGGRSTTLHLCSIEPNRSPRTPRSLHEEAVLQLLEKTDFCGNVCTKSRESLRGKEMIIYHMQETVKNNAKTSVYISRSDAEWYLANAILGLLREPVLQDLYDRVNSFISSGGMDSKKNAHQAKRALDAVRNAANHAFKHGVDIEDIVTAVKETLVQNVLTT